MPIPYVSQNMNIYYMKNENDLIVLLQLESINVFLMLHDHYFQMSQYNNTQDSNYLHKKAEDSLTVTVAST